MSAIHLHNLVKKFGGFTALKTMDLEIADGEFMALLGPSGSAAPERGYVAVYLGHAAWRDVAGKALLLDGAPRLESSFPIGSQAVRWRT